jgi:hypothetical protein
MTERLDEGVPDTYILSKGIPYLLRCQTGASGELVALTLR